MTDKYKNLPERILDIYDTCSDDEKQYLIQILQELSETGTSSTYDDLWLQDYKEIPVDIDTFLNDNEYLGLTNRQGESVYPYWRKSMHDIFDNGNQYTQCVFTGATRIGKTSTAITCAAFMLYRMMCLRDPQAFFQKKEISQFSLLFFNLTLDLAKSVAFREFNDTLELSPWFQKHGVFSGGKKDRCYYPEGGKIVIEAGSDVAHSLGKQVFCLTGNTKVLTSNGWYRLDDLSKFDCNNLQIFSYDLFNSGGLTLTKFDGVKLTQKTKHTIRVYIDSYHYIEGSYNHRLMIQDNADTRYVELQNIQVGDTLVSVNPYSEGVKVYSISHLYYEDTVDLYDVINCNTYHNFIVECGDEFLVSHNCAVLDEVNFARSGVKDITKAKSRIKGIYDSVVARVEGTFRMRGQVYGKIFAVSSKKTDSDFLEDHVEAQLSAGNTHLISFDRPQWEVLPPEQFSPGRFYIAVGDKHHKGFVLQDESEEALTELRNQGYQLLQVPIDMKSNFLSDFDISLRDLAGIAVPGALSFITQAMIDDCTGGRKNPFYQDILEIGIRDTYTLEEFFHMELIDRSLLHLPLYLGIDLSLNDDKTGISGAWLNGYKEITSEDGKTVRLPFFSHAFSIDIQAPRGDKIPYAKITSFILWLRRKHFNIQRISRDQFQSEYMAQLLEQEGFICDKVSVDRTPDGYEAFKSMLLEKRVDLLYVEQLQNELVKLEKDALSGKIDHRIGESKDMSDSLVRCIWNAVLNEAKPQVSKKHVASAIASVNTPKIATNSDKLASLFPGLYPKRK